MIALTSLMPHQEIAVAKVASLRVGALFMEMGTGKSRTIIEIALRKFKAKKINRVLWFCPVSGKWDGIEREIQKHIQSPKYHIFDDKTEVGAIPGADWYVIGHESLGSSIRVYEAALSLAPDSLIIVDESHNYKSWHAKRTERMMRIGDLASYRYILTGTPISKGIEDIYSQLHFLSPKILGYRDYSQFCRHHIDWDVEKPGKIKARRGEKFITSRMAPYVFQIKKEECLTLPERMYQRRSFCIDSSQRKLYDRAKDEILFADDALTAEDVTIYRLFTALQQCVSGYWNRNGEEMIRAFENPAENPRIELLQEIIEEIPKERKIIIWCKFNPEVTDICQALADVYGADSFAMMTGAMRGKKRSEQITKFRESCRFLVANIAAGSSVLTLNEAKYAIYYSNTFKLATRWQSEARNHRIGQDSEVTYIDLYAVETIDQMILNYQDRKESMAESFRRQIQAIRQIKNKEDAEKALKELMKTI